MEIIMKLSFEQIKSVTVGAVDIKQDGDEIKFFKCTEKQTKGWYEASEILGYRSLTTSGVRLDFHTSSKRLTFEVGGGERFEVLVNGTLRARFTAAESEKLFTVDLTETNGRSADGVRVILAFPSHTVGTLKRVELDDGATLTPHEYSRKMLFIGDSITQGYNTKFDTLSYAWQTTLNYNANSIINGIGGAFYHIPTYDRPDFEPDTVILAYGTNDAMRYQNNRDEMHRQVCGYLDLIKEGYENSQVIVISPIFRATDGLVPIGEWFDERRTMIEDEARRRGFDVISGLDLVPPLPDFYADRYLHPNDLGFTCYALNLIRKLDEVVRA
ncbi:MAG: SGNH/GDSL hydrolase family protein [Clostridia bacterium]|nr:SGNH/GDSL hydrolase family protein [Clostridia bacterium]